jgi:hypothetical protein
VIPHVGDGSPDAPDQRLKPLHSLQDTLLEVHHQQRRALRVEGGCLIAHAFSPAVVSVLRPSP